MSIFFYARGDSSSANNSELNSQNTSTTPTTLLEFIPDGDVILDTNGGLSDPDTLLSVNGGTPTTFTVEFYGYLPLISKLSNVNGYDLQGEPIVVITDDTTLQRYYFLANGQTLFPDLATMYATMDAMPNGAIAITAVDYNPPGGVTICFARGSRIETPDRGLVPVEQLCAGDLVICETGPMPIVWVGSSNVSYTRLLAAPHLRPIKIAPGAIGDNLPAAEVNLSPNHRVVLDNWRISLAIGSERALCPAKHLVNNTTITRTLPAEGVEYFHILVDGHHIVSCEGLPCETLFTGPIALQSLEPAAREELETLFPHLRDETAIQMAPLALPELKAHEARALG